MAVIEDLQGLSNVPVLNIDSLLGDRNGNLKFNGLASNDLIFNNELIQDIASSLDRETNSSNETRILFAANEFLASYKENLENKAEISLGEDKLFTGSPQDLEQDELFNSSPQKNDSAKPKFTLAPAFDSAPLGDSKTSFEKVSLLGLGEPHAKIKVKGSDITTTANEKGQFTLENVPLSIGNNKISLVSFDNTGDRSYFSQNIKRIEQDDINAVINWNAVALRAAQLDKTLPPKASYNFALVHTAIYDTVNSLYRQYQPYRIDIDAPDGTSADAAVASAAYEILIDIYPTQTNTFELELYKSLAQIPDGTSENDGVLLGKQVAREILRWRENDGSEDVVDYVPGKEIDDWQPTPPKFADPILPQWPNVTPFALTEGSQFRPDGPPDIESKEFADEFNQVKVLGEINSKVRTADQTEIAKFWEDDLGTYLPSGHWNQIAEELAVKEKYNLVDSARLFAALNVSVADAGIAGWDAKYAFNFYRPITAIEKANDDGNPLTTPSANWQPLLITPPFPEYISGHSTVSGAASTVLTDFFGDRYKFTSTSLGLPGVTRTFNNFEQAAEEAGMSRIYGGIHFMSANTDGLETGRQISDYVISNFFKVNCQSS